MRKWWRNRLIPTVSEPFQVCSTGGSPVVLVSTGVRVERDAKLPPGIAYFVDGETFCVNGGYPYSKKNPSVFQKPCPTCPEIIYWSQEPGTPRDEDRTHRRCSKCTPAEWGRA